MIWISASRARRARYCGKLSQCGFDSPQFVRLVSDSEIDSLKRAVESLMTSNTEKVSATPRQSLSVVANFNVKHVFLLLFNYVAYTIRTIFQDKHIDGMKRTMRRYRRIEELIFAAQRDGKKGGSCDLITHHRERA